MYWIALNKNIKIETMNKEKEDFELYQGLCDEVFGPDVITVKPNPSNNIIGTLKYDKDYVEFKKNFKSRLMRLKKEFEGTAVYDKIKEVVSLIADKNNWSGAYAEIVAYDALSASGYSSGMSIDITLPPDQSFAAELNQKATNEDGYLPTIDMYFDVKRLADTTWEIINKIIKTSIEKSCQKAKCDIIPQYPLDDDEQIYQSNWSALCKELTDFLSSNKDKTSGKAHLRSSVVPTLEYNIIWGGGVNTAISTYDPYLHSEQTKDLIFARYTKKFMKNKPFALILVDFPWYNQRTSDFLDCDRIYYRSLARRTFCQYLHNPVPMKSILPKFSGQETIMEVSRHLTGIIFIRDNSITEDSITVCSYMNPNAANTSHLIKDWFLNMPQLGDTRSIFDDFDHDNY